MSNPFQEESFQSNATLTKYNYFNCYSNHQMHISHSFFPNVSSLSTKHPPSDSSLFFIIIDWILEGAVRWAIVHFDMCSVFTQCSYIDFLFAFRNCQFWRPIRIVLTIFPFVRVELMVNHEYVNLWYANNVINFDMWVTDDIPCFGLQCMATSLDTIYFSIYHHIISFSNI